MYQLKEKDILINIHITLCCCLVLFLQLSNLVSINAESLCDDLGVFEEYFPQPDDSELSPSDVQDVVCEALGADFTAVFTDLRETVSGLDDYINMVCVSSLARFPLQGIVPFLQ